MPLSHALSGPHLLESYQLYKTSGKSDIQKFQKILREFHQKLRSADSDLFKSRISETKFPNFHAGIFFGAFFLEVFGTFFGSFRGFQRFVGSFIRNSEIFHLRNSEFPNFRVGISEFPSQEFPIFPNFQSKRMFIKSNRTGPLNLCLKECSALM